MNANQEIENSEIIVKGSLGRKQDQNRYGIDSSNK